MPHTKPSQNFRGARSLFEALHRGITQPGAELNRWQRAARWLYDFCRYGWRQLNEDDALSLAAALSFRTLFGLLPVLVVVTIMAKAFLGDNLAQVVDWVVALLGADGVQVSSATAGVESVPLGAWLKTMVNEAGRFSVSGLGWVGAGLLVYAAISLMVTIETSFNRIVRAPSGRPWLKRIPLYWFVLTIGPILLAVTPFLDARYSAAVASISTWQWALQLAKLVWNVLIIWAFMSALYLWVPNVSLRIRPVLVGALFAAILLELGKRFLGAYLNNAFTVSKLAGSLGLVPLFMFWVYLMWMVVLLGLEVAAMVQFLRGRQMEELEKSRPKREMVDPNSVVVLMHAAATKFAAGQATTGTQLGDIAGISSNAVRPMIDLLVQRGYLHRLEHPEGGVVLAKPAEAVSTDELIRAGWDLVDAAPSDSASAGVLASLREAQARLAAGTTLATIGGR